jgi:hypothetical protein
VSPPARISLSAIISGRKYFTVEAVFASAPVWTPRWQTQIIVKVEVPQVSEEESHIAIAIYDVFG